MKYVIKFSRIITMRSLSTINQTSSFSMPKINGILLLTFHLLVCLSASHISKRIDRFDSGIKCDTASVEQHTYMASLSAYSGDNIDNAEECSGTLISEWHILTSASCVQNRDGELYDEVNVLLRPCSSISINRTVFRNGIMAHNNYNYTHTAQGDNDIAVLRMSERIDLTENPFLSLISLPQKCNSCVVDSEGEPAIAVGWNETFIGEGVGQVMQVEIQVQSNQWCKKEAGNFYLFNNEYQLCTAQKGLVPSDMEESCQRHNGGPIIVGGTQIGIKSYGNGKCEEAAIYTRVSAYVNSGWIAEKIAL